MYGSAQTRGMRGLPDESKGFSHKGNIYRRQKISSKTLLRPVASELESRPCTQCGWAISAHSARQERKQEVSTSRKLTFVAVLVFCLAVSPMMMAQSSGFTNNHFEVGAFADYFRLSSPNPNINFVGVGGRVGFNVHPNVALEAEMSYDFGRNITTTTSNGGTTNFFQSRTRPITGLFGPKFQVGTDGPFRAFVTAKVGFTTFSHSTASPTSGFVSGVSDIANGGANFAVYPGAGIEAFAGPIGIRLEAGDDIYFLNGARNNLKVSVGPVIRF
jgi:hypothetical protein